MVGDREELLVIEKRLFCVVEARSDLNEREEDTGERNQEKEQEDWIPVGLESGERKEIMKGMVRDLLRTRDICGVTSGKLLL